jgi:translation initiation factor 1
VSRKKPAPEAPPAAAFHAPFAALAPLREALPEGTFAEKARPPRPPPPRAVVRLEKKGRRGKEVTVVEQLQLSSAERQAWLGELRRALGCGGVEEDEALVLQGDHRQRVEAFLKARGVVRVSVG